MERFSPLFIVALAFITAVWSYVYFADFSYAKNEDQLTRQMEEAGEEPAQSEFDLVKVQAKHILVKTLKEANELRSIICLGEDFEKIAKQKSLCPSGRAGGDLGYIERGQMVDEFEKAAFALSLDEISMPVKTQFGWHLIKITDMIYNGE